MVCSSKRRWDSLLLSYCIKLKAGHKTNLNPTNTFLTHFEKWENETTGNGPHCSLQSDPMNMEVVINTFHGTIFTRRQSKMSKLNWSILFKNNKEKNLLKLDWVIILFIPNKWKLTLSCLCTLCTNCSLFRKKMSNWLFYPNMSFVNGFVVYCIWSFA